jgi:hypothetical protein
MQLHGSHTRDEADAVVQMAPERRTSHLARLTGEEEEVMGVALADRARCCAARIAGITSVEGRLFIATLTV